MSSCLQEHEAGERVTAQLWTADWRGVKWSHAAMRSTCCEETSAVLLGLVQPCVLHDGAPEEHAAL